MCASLVAGTVSEPYETLATLRANEVLLVGSAVDSHVDFQVVLPCEPFATLKAVKRGGYFWILGLVVFVE